METRVSGNVTEVISLRPLNTPSAMAVTPSGITISCSRLLQAVSTPSSTTKGSPRSSFNPAASTAASASEPSEQMKKGSASGKV